MESAFKKNLKFLEEQQKDTKDAFDVELGENLEICDTRKGQKNLRYEKDDKVFYLHSNYDAEQESRKWFAQLDLQSKKVLFLYGIGYGYSYDAIKEWLEEDIERYLVYIEDDPLSIRLALENPHLEEILSHHQVRFYFINDKDEDREGLCCYLATQFTYLPFCFEALPHHNFYRSENFEKIRLKFHHKSAQANFSSFEFLNFGASYFGNLYASSLLFKDAFESKKLFKLFNGFPAIICGAGPSLNKNFKLLKTLQDRAFIFAGGSSINALTSKGLIPHFGGSVDPNYPQYERMSQHSGFELPIFYKARMRYEAFQSLHGPRIYISGSGVYPITGEIEKELGINHQMIPEGCNVLQMLAELACHMGFNPIVFVGIDMAYSNNCLYADGVVEKSQVDEKSLTKANDLNNNCFLRKDIFGNDVYTLWKWVAESEQAAKFPKRHPDITFINASEGGLGMGPDIPNISLSQVLREHLKRPIPCQEIIHSLLQESRCELKQSSPALLKKLLFEFYECYELIEEIKNIFERLKDGAKRNNKIAIQRACELIKEPQEKLKSLRVYQKVLLPLNTVRGIHYQRKLDQIEFNDKIESKKEQIIGMCDTNLEELSVHQRAIVINVEKIESSVRNYVLQGFGEADEYFKEGKEARVFFEELKGETHEDCNLPDEESILANL